MSTLSGTTSKSQWPFSPQSITGLTLWLDGADTSSMIFSSGASVVTTWKDKSGNGANATASGSPTSSGNGVVFPSTGTTFSFSRPYTSAHTVYVVATPTSSSQVYLFGRGSPNGEPSLILNYSGTTLEYYDDPDSGRQTLGTPTTTFIASYIRSPGVSVVGRLNGSQIFTEGGPSSEYSSVAWGYLGSANGSAGWYTGTISEFMIFSVALTTSQAQQVEGYLAQKWGLQANLPGTHPYYATSSTQLYKQPIFQRTFSPVDISGCSLWLDGSDTSSMTFTSGTSTVTAWKDKSGNAVNLTGVGGPTSTGNGVVFGANQYCSSSFSFNLASRSIFVVCITTSANDGRGILTLINTAQTNDYDNINSLILNTTSAATNAMVVTANAFASSPTINNTITSPSTKAILYADTWSGTSFNVYNAGTSAISYSENFTPGTSNSVLVGARWFSGAVNAGGLNGTVFEVILYNSALSSSQRQQVESYLAWKWRLVSSLPTSPVHPGKLLPAFSTVFSPKSISGISLWLDAADQQSITLSISSVTTWKDKSGNGYNATGGVSPTYSSNGVQFNGSSYLTTSAPAGNNSATYFIVFKPSSIGFTVLLGGNVVSTATLFVGDSTSFVLGDWNLNVATFTTSFSAGTTYIASGMASGGVLSVSINAGTMATGSRTFSGSGTFTIGAGYIDNRAKYSGAINEIIVFNSALSVSDRQKVEGYLASKWGVQANLPETHAFKKNKP